MHERRLATALLLHSHGTNDYLLAIIGLPAWRALKSPSVQRRLVQAVARL
jgi:hypothetical protein